MESLPSYPPSKFNIDTTLSSVFLSGLVLSASVIGILVFWFLVPHRKVLQWAFEIQWIRRIILSVIKLGPIPAHVAFIMDGNRRFAKKLQVQTKQGHLQGFKTLEKTLEVCLDLGVQVVSVYAFSIENFRRSEEEVRILMELFADKLRQFSQNDKLVEKYGIKVRVIGKLELLPVFVLKAVEEVHEMTKTNDRAVLNVCCPYTSQHEISTSIMKTVNDVREKFINSDQITATVLESNLFTGNCPKLDILIRTSGEVRLSDYMLWQSDRNCLIKFVEVNWPEFTFWDMIPTVFYFQWRRFKNLNTDDSSS